MGQSSMWPLIPISDFFCCNKQVTRKSNSDDRSLGDCPTSCNTPFQILRFPVVFLLLLYALNEIVKSSMASNQGPFLSNIA